MGMRISHINTCYMGMCRRRAMEHGHMHMCMHMHMHTFMCA